MSWSVEKISAITTAVATVAGLVAGIVALNIYQSQRWDSNYSRLEERDREIANIIFEYPELAMIYVPPSWIPGKPAAAFENYLSIRSKKYASLVAKEKYNSVPDFSCKFWTESFDAEVRLELTRHYFVAEYHALTLSDAWQTFDENDEADKRVRENFLAYVNEIGTDIFFLSSVFELARHGYYDPDFFSWLQVALVSDPDRALFYKDFWPILLDKDEWGAFVSEGVLSGDTNLCRASGQRMDNAISSHH